MHALSLHKVMNEIAAHPDMVPVMQDNFVKPEAAAHGHHFDMEEVTPFLGSDPVILDLVKDYLNAKADYHSALLAHGKDSPFADIAGDHLDSAWCVLQARIFELKQDRAIASRAAFLEKVEKKTFEAQQEHKFRKLKEEREAACLEAIRKRVEAEEDDRWDNLWLFIIFLLATRDPMHLFGNVFAGPPRTQQAWQ